MIPVMGGDYAAYGDSAGSGVSSSMRATVKIGGKHKRHGSYITLESYVHLHMAQVSIVLSVVFMTLLP